MLPVEGFADEGPPAIVRLVCIVQAALANPNPFLGLAQDLILLAFAICTELGTGNNSVVQKILPRPAAEVALSI